MSKNKDISVITQQQNDLVKDKVRRINFFIDKNTFKKLKVSEIVYDFSQYNLFERERDEFVKLTIYFKTKKLTKINESAFLALNCFDAYRFSEYVTSNDALIKGRNSLEGLIQNSKRKLRQ